MRWIFFFSVLGIFFSYFGYPISLWAVSLVRSRKVKKRAIEPMVTVIVAAHNEEKRIEHKIQNMLQWDYPPEKLEIIIVSDGSTDRTNEIVAGYAPSGLKLLALPEHKGKEYAQSRAVQMAQGDILVFTDAAARFEPGGLRAIVSNFGDDTVGCVSSEDSILGQSGSSGGEGLYVKYEMWLRRLESCVNSVVGASGSFFAAQKCICLNFTPEMDGDFQTVLNSVHSGLRAVSDQDAVCYYADLADPTKEMERKIRTVSRGIALFFNNLRFLNCFRFGFFSYQFLSHKLLRWLVPFFAAGCFLSNCVLARDSLYFGVLLVLQIIFYAAGLTALYRGRRVNSVLLKISSYFVMVNLSIAIAWLRFIKGERVVMWTPSDR